jgi:hypothetical protein
LLGAAAGCGKSTQVESGAVMLDLSVAAGVTTPDELELSIYDDTGALWNEQRIPASGALVPESATHLGTVLVQPGAATGALRVHARALAASARVADGTLTIPAGARGTFALRLDADAPADGDGDGVPDAIDNCPAVANPSQGSCPGTNDGGMDAPGDTAPPDDGGGDAARDTAPSTDGGGDAPRDMAPPNDGGGGDLPRDTAPPTDGGTDAPRDGGGMDAVDCTEAGTCNRPTGSQCSDGSQCKSSFCVDGVCCANACIGPCRSCNQPNMDGICQPYAQGTDPAGECTGGLTCNGAGACGPPAGGQKPNGSLCAGTGDCTSGFCKDGVCCNSACDTPCHTCETGTCATVSRKPDPPECYGAMTCNPSGKCVAN